MEEHPEKRAAVVGERRRVLVVDDEPDVADSLATLLQALGYEARSVYHAQAAVAAVAEFKPHTAFVDVRLPDVDGYEISRRLRQSSPQLRIVALTGSSDDGRTARAVAHFDAFILKPASMQNIERALAATA